MTFDDFDTESPIHDALALETFRAQFARWGSETDMLTTNGAGQ